MGVSQLEEQVGPSEMGRGGGLPVSSEARDLLRHAPVERDARAAPLELARRLFERLDPLDASVRLVEQVFGRVHKVGIDDDDVGVDLLARLEPDTNRPVAAGREENLRNGRVEADVGVRELLVEDLEERRGNPARRVRRQPWRNARGK